MVRVEGVSGRAAAHHTSLWAFLEQETAAKRCFVSAEVKLSLHSICLSTLPGGNPTIWLMLYAYRQTIRFEVRCLDLGQCICIDLLVDVSGAGKAAAPSANARSPCTDEALLAQAASGLHSGLHLEQTT